MITIESDTIIGRKIVGDPRTFVTINAITNESEGWKQVTSALAMPGGCLVKTCTIIDFGNQVSEALCYVPNAKVTIDGKGIRRLV